MDFQPLGADTVGRDPVTAQHRERALEELAEQDPEGEYAEA